jgi:hypothetical protein
MYEMSEEERAERARVRDLHARVRSFGCANRIVNLAWGFVRGFKYRRIERRHRLQRIDTFGPSDVEVRPFGYAYECVVRNKEGCFYEHNFPSATALHRFLSVNVGLDVTIKDVWDWLSDPEGAIPCPPPRPRPKLPRPESTQAVMA